jgi:hypothetical protein
VNTPPVEAAEATDTGLPVDEEAKDDALPVVTVVADPEDGGVPTEVAAQGGAAPPADPEAKDDGLPTTEATADKGAPIDTEAKDDGLLEASLRPSP